MALKKIYSLLKRWVHWSVASWLGASKSCQRTRRTRCIIVSPITINKNPKLINQIIEIVSSRADRHTFAAIQLQTCAWSRKNSRTRKWMMASHTYWIDHKGIDQWIINCIKSLYIWIWVTKWRNRVQLKSTFVDCALSPKWVVLGESVNRSFL